MIRVAFALIMLGASTASAGTAERAPLKQQGRILVEKMCGGCHAIGKDDTSPHVAAPAFRILDRQLDLDSFADRLRRGLLTGHQDMPMFRLSRDDAYAITAYIRSIQGP